MYSVSGSANFDFRYTWSQQCIVVFRYNMVEHCTFTYICNTCNTKSVTTIFCRSRSTMSNILNIGTLHNTAIEITDFQITNYTTINIRVKDAVGTVFSSSNVTSSKFNWHVEVVTGNQTGLTDDFYTCRTCIGTCEFFNFYSAPQKWEFFLIRIGRTPVSCNTEEVPVIIIACDAPDIDTEPITDCQ